MDRKLQKQLLGSGIIPTNAVKQMEGWRNLPKGSTADIGKFAPEKVQELREELELQTLPTLRETILDIDRIMSRGREVLIRNEGIEIHADAGVDVLQRYIFEIPGSVDGYQKLSLLMRPFSVIHDETLPAPNSKRMITEISVLYSTVNDSTSVPTHWFCVTEARGENHILRAR